MFEYTIAHDLIPQLGIIVEKSPDAPSLSAIKLSLPKEALTNEWASNAFRDHLAASYDLDAVEKDGAYKYTLKPRAENWESSADGYVRRFARHVAAYYEIPLSSVYQQCVDPEQRQRLLHDDGSKDLAGKISILDEVTTDDIVVTIAPCASQGDFCAWLGDLYDAERTESGGAVTLRLKGLKGTYDTLSHPGHLVRLTQAMLHSWDIGRDDVLQSIQPPVAREYCDMFMRLRSASPGVDANGETADITPYGKEIIVVGTGFSGVSVTAQILKPFIDEPPTQPIRMYLIERNPAYLMAGLAYGAAGPEHRVNVMAPYMGVDGEHQDDLVEWLKTVHRSGHLGDGRILDIPTELLLPTSDYEHTVIQRRLEHYYLMSRLFETVKEANARGIADVEIVIAEAVRGDVVPGQEVTVYAKDGRAFKGTDLVLSNGHGPIKTPPFLAGAHEQLPTRVVVDQWTQNRDVEAVLKDPSIKNVVVLGTGLSAMDIVMTAERVGFFDDPTRTLTLLSRGAHLHPVLVDGQEYKEPTLDTASLLARLPKTIDDVPAFVGTVFGELKSQGLNTVGRAHTNEEAFFAFTSKIPELLQACTFDPKDFMPLLRKYSSLITTTAVSMAPVIGKVFEAHHKNGKIQIIAAEPKVVQCANAEPAAGPANCLCIDVERGGAPDKIYCDAIISALPPQSDPKSVPLIRDLMEKGILSEEKKLGTGVAVTEDYRAVGTAGTVSNVFIDGPILGGTEMARHGNIGPLFQIARTLREETLSIARGIISDYRQGKGSIFCLVHK